MTASEELRRRLAEELEESRASRCSQAQQLRTMEETSAFRHSRAALETAEVRGELEAALTMAAQKTTELYIVQDALDEMNSQDERISRLREQFQELQAEAPRRDPSSEMEQLRSELTMRIINDFAETKVKLRTELKEATAEQKLLEERLATAQAELAARGKGVCPRKPALMHDADWRRKVWLKVIVENK
ncbi:unnamed protein product, partial [Symbiodinium microadriaticum]